MKGDIAVAGFMLTAEEWEALDVGSRAQLVAVITRREDPSGPFASGSGPIVLDAAPIDSGPVAGVPVDSAPIELASIDSGPSNAAPVAFTSFDSAPILELELDESAPVQIQA